MENNMEKKKITFIEDTALHTQESVASILKNHQYKFKRVNEFDNTRFYCYVLICDKNKIKTAYDKLFGWAGADVNDEKVYEVRMNLTVSDSIGTYIDIPMIFSKQDITNIVEDYPQNYVGENEI